MKTYEIGTVGGEEYILCFRCGSKSYYGQDIANKYCGKCGFHVEGTHVSHPEWEHAVSQLHLAQRRARKAFIFASIAIFFAIAALVIPIIW